jgi:hypothetical protein
MACKGTTNMKHLAVLKQTTTELASQPAGGRGKESSFYVGAAIFVIVLSIIGFGPSIIDQSRRNAPSTLLVMAHGIAVGGWLLLFLTQAILVATGRTAIHRRFGIVGPGLALLMIVLGYVVLIHFGRRGYDVSGDVIRALSRTGSRRFNPAVILFPLGELLSFGVLVGAGLWYRHRADVHKRLMLLAMVPILGEPILHLVGHVAGRWPSLRGKGTPISVAATLVLLSASAMYDRLSRRHIHPVSLWVPILLFVWQIALGAIVFPSAVWRNLVSWLVQ